MYYFEEKNDFKIIYNGKIRSGSYGKNTDKNHKIIECINCGLTRMEEFVNIDYISDSYRLLYNDSNKISDYFKIMIMSKMVELIKLELKNFAIK